jgi:uncharacterized protein YutE (UPF0331/DUF86 family)
MTPRARKTAKQLRSEITAHLEDFPRQVEALESSMEEFGERFEIADFKVAFEGKSGVKAYNSVQAVERALTRVQNYIAHLSESGAMLAELELPKTHAGTAARTFDALKEARVIGASLCTRLKRAQRARSELEHEYVRITAGDVHKAAGLVADAAHDFIGPYRKWIEQFL